MNALTGRLLIALWFISIIAVAAWGGAAPGSAQDKTKLSLPLITSHALYQADPPLQDYLGVVVARALEEADHDIYTVRADGSDLRQLTDDGLDALSVAWSPDSRRIAFARPLAADSELSEVMVMNLDGSDLRPALAQPDPARVLDIRWSPRSDHLLILRADLDWLDSLVVVAPDGSAEIISTPGWFPSGWSPDGERVHFSTDNSGQIELWVYTLATRQRVRIGTMTGGSVLWRASGNELLYIEPTLGEVNRGILVNANGTNRRTIFEGPYGRTAWLLGETRILLWGWYQPSRLHTVPTTGGAVTPLTEDEFIVGGVSPDGSAVLYGGVDRDLWLHPIGASPRRLPDLECESPWEYCSLGPGAQWAQDGSTVVYLNHKVYYRFDSIAVYAVPLDITPLAAHQFTGNDPHYLPYSSSRLAIDDASGYPSYLNTIRTADSNEMTETPLPGFQGFSNYAAGWRYLP